jgi:hypothetical protein
MAEEALRDQELFDRVREIVDEEAGELETGQSHHRSSLGNVESPSGLERT